MKTYVLFTLDQRSQRRLFYVWDLCPGYVLYPRSEVPERQKSEQGREKEDLCLAERDKPLWGRTNQLRKSRIWTSLWLVSWSVDCQTSWRFNANMFKQFPTKSCKDGGAFCLLWDISIRPVNSQQRGRKGEKKKETCRNNQGFRFPNTGDLCPVQINYSGRKHNHTETRVSIFA